MGIAEIAAILPVAVQLTQTISTIIANMTAAGRTTTTAEEAAALAQSRVLLANATATFNAQFADVLPTA